ncbi:capsid protein [Fadolivirus algeromassiliense]|jgi:hypothetical protein|uniref:Capsid protein n=1 Tax=Fadolivirus FV1/VV64 TaxID=3070911 RepID=A0A7D3QUV6_9VIRU|nr:capsid protein [Fadolivirus algeromassiliense]QKF94485.1 capsid protein [Fadolivirus FV1/VV64]
MTELLYNNNPIDISNSQNDIKCIDLKMCFEKLGDNIIPEEFYPYKILNSIEIWANGQRLFATNGMIIKSLISSLYPKYQKKDYGYIYEKEELINAAKSYQEYIIPLFIVDLPLGNYMKTSINIQFNDYFQDKFKVYVIPTYTIKVPDNTIIKTLENQMEILNLSQGMNKLKYKCNFHGIIKHLLFYIEGNKLEEITLSINGITRTYSYIELNEMLPFYYLGTKLPKNYMYISFYDNNQDGLNLDKIDNFEIEFKLKHNNEGNIYIITQNKNLFMYSNGMTAMKYEYNKPYICYQWNGKFNYNYDNIDIKVIKIEI